MAEPVVTKVLEDIVSSVRRLVAPEASPRPMSRDLGAERLLLTPALRVVADDVLPASALPPEALPEAADSAAPHDLTVVVDANPTGMEYSLHVAAGDWDDVFWNDIGKLHPGPPAKAVDEAVVSAPADNALPQAGGQDIVVDGHLEGSAEKDVISDWIAEDAPAELPAVAVEDSVVSFPQSGEARASLSAAISEAQSAGTEAIAGLTDADGNPVTVIDEAALHDIVRSLIRDELQGILGERITQNVRKLVRAEVNRALTARSLD